MHQLYNNAGIAFSRSVLETEYADYERLFAVNLWGVITVVGIEGAHEKGGVEWRARLADTGARRGRAGSA